MMGFNLRRWFADYLPPGLSPGERLVALEIADLAKDETRLAFGRGLLETVARRTGYADSKQVGKVLGRLAAKGIELRVQIVKGDRPLFDRKGRPVFAHEGRQTTYRIPTLGLEVPPDLLTYRYRPNRYQAEEERAESFGRVLLPLGEHSGAVPSVVSCSGDHSAPVFPSAVPSGLPPGSQWPPEESSVVPQRGDPSPHVSSESPRLSPAAGGPPNEEGLVNAEIAELLSAQGRRPVSQEWAKKVRREILDERGGVRDPRAYVLAAVRREPEKYVPQSGPWQRSVPDAGQVRPELARSAASKAREQYPNLRHHRGRPSEGEQREGGSGV